MFHSRSSNRQAPNSRQPGRVFLSFAARRSSRGALSVEQRLGSMRSARWTVDSNPSELTALLRAFTAGDRAAEEQLFRSVYDELSRMAHQQLRGERAGHSLQTTALVNEAYLRLADGSWDRSWHCRRQFFWAAAESMRRILVDRARRAGRARRGGAWKRVNLDPECFPSQCDEELLALDETIAKLEALDPRKAHIVKLRYFVGLTVEETAEIVAVSPRTVKEEWRIARLWLRREIAGKDGSG